MMKNSGIGRGKCDNRRRKGGGAKEVIMGSGIGRRATTIEGCGPDQGSRKHLVIASISFVQ